MSSNSTIGTDKDKDWFYYPNLNFPCTESFSLFALDYHLVIEHFFFMIGMAHSIDRTRAVAKAALDDQDLSDENVEEIMKSSEKGSASEKASRLTGLNIRNLTNNIVDSFLWFISASLQSAIKRQPLILKSSEKVAIEEILDFRNHTELIKFLIDRKVSRLSYGGLAQLETYIRETLGIELFQNDDVRRKVFFFVEVRNINSHNRGYVSSTFLRRVSGLGFGNFEEGQRVYLRSDIIDYSRSCMESAMAFDSLVSKKFRVRRRKLGNQIPDKRLNEFKVHLHLNSFDFRSQT